MMQYTKTLKGQITGFLGHFMAGILINQPVRPEAASFARPKGLFVKKAGRGDVTNVTKCYICNTCFPLLSSTYQNTPPTPFCNIFSPFFPFRGGIKGGGGARGGGDEFFPFRGGLGGFKRTRGR